MESRIFCPRCATENGAEQSFCRQCGQNLSGIQWVLEGSLAESQKRLEAAEKWIKAGNSTLIAFISIAVTIAILNVFTSHPALIPIAIINVLTGLLIGAPFLLVGGAKLIKAKRLVSQPHSKEKLAVPGSPKKELPAPETDELGPPPRPSVTEHTTLHLTKPDSSRR
jgi:hypothetical protein